jgi:nitrogen regulatory protein PII
MGEVNITDINIKNRMELVIITAVQAFEQDIKQLLKAAGVQAFSYTHVTGYTARPNSASNANWFASEAGEHQSVLFYVFMASETAQKVLSAVTELNAHEESRSHVHAAIVPISQAI